MKKIILKDICIKDIKIGNALDLYKVLDGDNILNKFIDKSKKKENDDIKGENKDKGGNEIINTENTQADEIQENDDDGNNELNEDNEEDDNEERDDY